MGHRLFDKAVTWYTYLYVGEGTCERACVRAFVRPFVRPFVRICVVDLLIVEVNAAVCADKDIVVDYTIRKQQVISEGQTVSWRCRCWSDSLGASNHPSP